MVSILAILSCLKALFELLIVISLFSCVVLKTFVFVLLLVVQIRLSNRSPEAASFEAEDPVRDDFFDTDFGEL